MEKKLYRDVNNKMVCGVCSGVAKYFNVDVNLVRLGVVLVSLLFAGFGGILAYIIAVLLLPEEPAEGAAPAETVEPAGEEAVAEDTAVEDTVE